MDAAASRSSTSESRLPLCSVGAVKIYFAGPLFTPYERSFIDECAAVLRADGFEVFVPHAHGLALKPVRPTEVSGVEFSCFRPTSISPRTLASMFRNTDAVPIAPKDNSDGAFGFFDDRTEVAKVVRVHLGERLFTPAPTARPAVKQTPPPGPTSPPVSVARPAPAPKPTPPPKPRKPHVLEPLIEALGHRVGKLGVGTFEWIIDEKSSDLVMFTWGQLVVGGENPRLRLLASELSAKSILVGPAIDAVAAHAVSVLNLALTEVTDANESHAIGVLLSTPPSGGPQRSRRS